MLEKSFGLFFFLKQPKNQKSEERYVYVRITVNGTSKEVSIKRVWQPERWNQSAGRATGNKEDARSLNVFIDSLSAKIYQAKIDLLDQNKAVTAENLKQAVTGQTEQHKMLLEIFREHISQIKEMIGKGFAKRTHQCYCTTLSHTKAFIKWKYNVADLALVELDYEFASQFYFWLKAVKNCNHNTTVKYISTLKSIVIQCVLKKWIKFDPFIGFKTTTKEVEIVPLTKEELNIIENKVYSIERLNVIRDIFLFSCYTGLAYIDAMNLKRTQIVTGVDGEPWILTHRQKTKSPTRIPMLKPAITIMERYKSNDQCLLNNSVLPKYSNQKTNAYLKEIADTCRINKRITFHIARHTFATTVTLSNGVPMETVSKMLGHKSIKQTQHYAKLTDLKMSFDMMTLKEKLYPES